MGKEEEVREKEFLVREDVERPWKDMPGELLQSISNLSLSDHIRFRLTCNRWNNIELPPRSIPLRIELTSELSKESPQFMFFHTSGSGECSYFNPIYNTTYQTHIPEFLEGAFIRHSKHGWLLLSRAKRSFFFFHPLKKVVINLPNSTFTHENSILSFSSPPTSSDCVVFATTQLSVSPSEVKIHFCRHGSDSWHTRRYKVDGPTFVPSLCNPLFINGVFYCLSVDGRLGFFDPSTRTWEIAPRLRGPNVRGSMSFMVEHHGDLISVFFGKMGVGVCIYKLDWDKKKWVELDDLGDRMMFVSHATSMLLPAIIKGTENKIYLPRFRKQENVFYSLYTRKYSIFHSDYPREDWYTTHEYLNSTWIDLNSDTTMDSNKDNPHTDQELNWLSNAPEYDSADDSDDDAEVYYDTSDYDDSDDDD